MLNIVSKKSKIFSYSHSRLYKVISNQLALVTGFDDIGREICINLANKGCNIALVDTEGGCDFADQLQKDYLIKAKFFPTDITNYHYVQRLKRQVENDLGPVDILVNNAEIIPTKSTITESTRDEINQVIKLNLFSQFWTIKSFIPTMKQRGTGHIVAISSLAALAPFPKILDFCATQYAIRGLMESLKLELEMERLHNIHTTIIYSGFVEANQNYVTLVQEMDYLRVFPTSNTNFIAVQTVDSILKNEYRSGVPKWGPRYLKYTKWLPGIISRRFGPPPPPPPKKEEDNDDECDCP